NGETAGEKNALVRFRSFENPPLQEGFGCNKRPGAPSVPAVRNYTGRVRQNSAFACLIQRRLRRKLYLDSGFTRGGRVQSCARAFLPHELVSCQFRKTAAFRYQFIESSVLDHASMIEHQNTRGIAYGGEAVRDHEGGAAPHHFVERGVDLG